MSLIWSLTLLIKFKVLFNKLHISQYKTLMYLCNYHIFEQTIIRCINKKCMSRTREILCLCLCTLLVMLWVDNLSQKKDNYATKCYLQMYPKWCILFIFYNSQMTFQNKFIVLNVLENTIWYIFLISTKDHYHGYKREFPFNVQCSLQARHDL